MNTIENKTESAVTLSKTFFDYKGWRFTHPFRCMCCGKMVTEQQWAFGRACASCDVGRCNHPRVSGVYSGPRQLIDESAEYFIRPDKWLNPESGLLSHHQDKDFPAHCEMMNKFTKQIEC